MAAQDVYKFPDCNICQDIWNLFACGAKVAYLGNFKTALDSHCPVHKPLFEQFGNLQDAGSSTSGARHEPKPLFEKLGKIEIIGPDPTWEYNEIDEVELHVSTAYQVDMVCSRPFSSWQSSNGFGQSIALVRKTEPNHPGTARVLDPDWCDLELIKQWESCCRETHGERCKNPMRIWKTRPAWLIDADQKCVVPGEGCESYIALSYRWGRASSPPMDGRTLQQLRKPHALENQVHSTRMAPILWHAMQLTSALGYRYLWADALCIVHDNVAEMVEQLSLMGAIYASAAFTIVAADGDGQDGLRGLEGISEPRGFVPEAIPFGDEKFIVRSKGTMRLFGSTPYFERGWTYQEFELSPRKLIFSHEELHWECQCARWHEELMLGIETGTNGRDRSLSILLAGFPNLEALGHLIERYNVRQLTYAEDCLPGIAGLLSVISRSFDGGFLYGLPEVMFDQVLGWEPNAADVNVCRRLRRPEGTLLQPSGLPSWSWIGWQGPVTIGRHSATECYPLGYETVETHPITKWSTSHSPDGPWRHIRATWFENRDAYKGRSRQLPRGWTAHPFVPRDPTPASHLIFPDGCDGTTIFKHVNFPLTREDDDNDDYAEGRFYYPFPVPEFDEAIPPFAPEQTAYISCRTHRAWLRAHRKVENIMCLVNETSKMVGTLHLHNEQQWGGFPERVDEGSPGRVVELVAISRSKKWTRQGDSDSDSDSDQTEGPITISESYAVLWVEWEAGVAYRLASGAVERTDWEALPLQEVHLILG